MSILFSPEFFLSLENDQIIWELRSGANVIASEKVSYVSDLRSGEAVLMELLQSARSILYEYFPIEGLEFVSTPEFAADSNFAQTGCFFIEVLQGTNSFLQSIHHLKGKAKDYSNTLFYEFEHADFHELYKLAKAAAPDRVFFKVGTTGFDKLTRHYVAEKTSFLSAKELVALIQQDQLNRIVIVNMYYAQMLLNQRVHLSTIINFLGGELVMVDFDLYDGSYRSKAAFHHNTFLRFSCYEHHQKYWDDLLELRNIRYFPTGFVAKPHKEFHSLKDGYDIVIASNARARELVSAQNALAIIFESFDRTRLADEFQLWYYSFLHWTRTRLEAPYAKKSQVNKVLYIIYLAAITLLKYETIAGLKTDRSIKLFGDNDWAQIFPEYYQGKYLDYYADFFSTRNHLNLLMNANFSYLENNPVFARALSLGVPFLCFPALRCANGFEGMRRLEYQNTDELGAKIEKVNDLICDPSLIAAKSKIEGLLKNGFEMVAQTIVEYTPKTVVGLSEYERLNQIELKEMVQVYEAIIGKHPERYREIYEILFENKTPAQNSKNYWLWEREYFQRWAKFSRH